MNEQQDKPAVRPYRREVWPVIQSLVAAKSHKEQAVRLFANKVISQWDEDRKKKRGGEMNSYRGPRVGDTWKLRNEDGTFWTTPLIAVTDYQIAWVDEDIMVEHVDNVEFLELLPSEGA